MATLIFASTSEARLSWIFSGYEGAAVKIYIKDKKDNEIASGDGVIVDRSGIIAANCSLILRWLDSVENDITIKAEDGEYYPLDKLIAYNSRLDVSLLKIDTKGRTLSNVDIDRIIDKNDSMEYIKGQIALYNRLSKRPPKKIDGKMQSPSASTVSRQRLCGENGSPHNDMNHNFYFECAVQYEKDKNYNEAIEAYKKALTIKNDYIDAVMNLGLIYYKIASYDEAINMLKQAVKIKPGYQPLLNKIGTIYMILGQYSMALVAFNDSLNINSKSPEAHFNIGITYFLNGNKEAAMNHYIILKNIDKEKAEELFNLVSR
ncbi:MAG: tetratricopeptide repeat protein [Nitrospirae bacterium]|nr:tetratricopeptide repeat protein [Nitrospirota bacterium]